MLSSEVSGINLSNLVYVYIWMCIYIHVQVMKKFLAKTG